MTEVYDVIIKVLAWVIFGTLVLCVVCGAIYGWRLFDAVDASVEAIRRQGRASNDKLDADLDRLERRMKTKKKEKVSCTFSPGSAVPPPVRRPPTR